MADNKAPDLDPGFDEVPLDEGFEEVPLTPKDQSLGQMLYDKAASMGSSALESGKNALMSGIQTTADLGRGLIQGVSLGGSDEAIGAIKATLDNTKVGSPEWIQLYRKYQQLEQDKNKEAQARSPIAYGGGQIGGLIAPALITAGASLPEEAAILTARGGLKLGAGQIAKQAAIAAGKGAVVGAGTGAIASGLQSEQGALIGATPEQKQALGADVAGGAITGAVVGGALSGAVKAVPLAYNALKAKAASKVTDYIADSPLLRQAQKAKELGEEGVNLYSNEAKYGPIGETSGLISQDTNNTRDLVDRIYNVDSKLGQNVGKAIDTATDQGVKVDLSQPMLQSVNTFKNLLEKDQTMMANPTAQKLYDTIFSMSNEGTLDASNLTPKAVQSLRNDVIDFADSVKQNHPDIANLGYQFQGQAGALLKQAVPEYATAANRFEEFRRLVPETIISGSTPVDISGVKLGNLKNDEAKLFQATKGMIQGAEVPGTGSSAASETYKNFINGLNTFDQNEAARLESGAISATDLPKLVDAGDKSQAQAMSDLVKDRADQSALLRQAWRVNPQESLGSSIKGATFGRGALVNMANKYGLYKDTLTKPMSSPIQLTKNLYNASEDQLRGLGQMMKDIPGISSVGDALLKGLENKDTTGVNAAIFSIMQNPQARILINAQDLNQKKDSQ